MVASYDIDPILVYLEFEFEFEFKKKKKHFSLSLPFSFYESHHFANCHSVQTECRPKIDIEMGYLLCVFMFNRKSIRIKSMENITKLYHFSSQKCSKITFYVGIDLYFVVKIFYNFLSLSLLLWFLCEDKERKRELFVNWLTQLLVRVKMMNDAKWCRDGNCLHSFFPHKKKERKERMKDRQRKRMKQTTWETKTWNFISIFVIGQHKMYILYSIYWNIWLHSQHTRQWHIANKIFLHLLLLFTIHSRQRLVLGICIFQKKYDVTSFWFLMFKILCSKCLCQHGQPQIGLHNTTAV